MKYSGLTIKTNKGTFILIDPDYFGKIKLPTDIEYLELGRLKFFEDDDYNKIIDNTSSKTSKEIFESIIKDNGYNLFKNPQHLGIFAMSDKGIIDTAKELYDREEDKTFRNPIVLQKL